MNVHSGLFDLSGRIWRGMDPRIRLMVRIRFADRDLGPISRIRRTINTVAACEFEGEESAEWGEGILIDLCAVEQFLVFILGDPGK